MAACPLSSVVTAALCGPGMPKLVKRQGKKKGHQNDTKKQPLALVKQLNHHFCLQLVFRTEQTAHRFPAGQDRISNNVWATSPILRQACDLQRTDVTLSGQYIRAPSISGRFYDKTDYNYRRLTAKHAGNKAWYISLDTAITINGQSVRRYYERSSVHTY